MNTLRYTSLPVFLILALFASCDQNPIFHNISWQQPPVTPIIRGSPQNMVVTEQRLYAWTQRGEFVWAFDSAGRWTSLATPPVSNFGGFGGLTAVGAPGNEILFAIVYSGGGSFPVPHLVRHSGNQWIRADVDLSAYAIGRLYSAGNNIFARAQLRSSPTSYVILRFVPNLANLDAPVEYERLSIRGSTTGDLGNNLVGALSHAGQIFIATARNGIFRVAPGIGGAVTPFTGASGFNVSGIFSTTNDLVIVGNTHNAGVIHVVRGVTAFTAAHTWESEPPTFNGTFFNGGMSVWRSLDLTYNNPSQLFNNWRPRLLLVGIRTNGRSHGYREFILDENANILNAAQARIPGGWDFSVENTFSTAENRSRYNSSIGTRSVRYILQVPNLGGNFYPVMHADGSPWHERWQPPVFASTSIDGLWAYNPREDWWNAEDGTILWH